MRRGGYLYSFRLNLPQHPSDEAQARRPCSRKASIEHEQSDWLQKSMTTHQSRIDVKSMVGEREEGGHVDRNHPPPDGVSTPPSLSTVCPSHITAHTSVVCLSQLRYQIIWRYELWLARKTRIPAKVQTSWHPRFMLS